MKTRPNWDQYFLNICKAVATNSKCLSRQIGVIIVKDRSIISTGFNGPPRGVPHCGWERFEKDPKLMGRLIYIYSYQDISNTCPRQLLRYKSGKGLEWCIAAHAETNAIVNAAKNGISTDGCKMFMTCGIPCKECLKLIINAGIEEIICTKETFYDEMAKFLLENSSLKMRLFYC